MSLSVSLLKSQGLCFFVSVSSQEPSSACGGSLAPKPHYFATQFLAAQAQGRQASEVSGAPQGESFPNPVLPEAARCDSVSLVRRSVGRFSCQPTLIFL